MNFQDFRHRIVPAAAGPAREALMLVGASGMSYEDAAAMCNCAVGTMKSRVNRARNRLAEMLSMQGRRPFWPGPDLACGSGCGGHAGPRRGTVNR